MIALEGVLAGDFGVTVHTLPHHPLGMCLICVCWWRFLKFSVTDGFCVYLGVGRKSRDLVPQDILQPMQDRDAG